MDVRAAIIHLPNFDCDVANRAAVSVADFSGQVRNFTDRGRNRVVQDQQIVVGVQRQMIRLERPFALGRRLFQFVGEWPGSKETERAASRRHEHQ